MVHFCSGVYTRLSADIYALKQPKLDAYFSRMRFIQLKSVNGVDAGVFPLLLDIDLGGMILTMYILKHLRANAILEASYTNETFDTESLKKQIALQGVFVRVC